MNLKLEKDLKVAVEIDGQNIISMDNGVLYQYMDENDILLYIKNDKGKEVKIKISKDDNSKVE